MTSLSNEQKLLLGKSVVVKEKKGIVTHVSPQRGSIAIFVEHNEYKKEKCCYSYENFCEYSSFEGKEEIIAKINEIEAEKAPRWKETAVLPLIKTVYPLYSCFVSHGVSSFVHFTAIDNLESILEKGLVPVKLQRENNIESIKTDGTRNDGTDNNNLSVEFPNYQMFYKKRLEMPDTNFVVLKISIDALYEEKLVNHFSFCTENAAKGEADLNKKSVWDIEAMFSEEAINHRGEESTRTKLGIPDRFTTNPQAEVLVDGIIPPRYISSVEYDDSTSYSQIKDIISMAKRYSLEANNNPGIFKYRSDYEFWKLNNNENDTDF